MSDPAPFFEPREGQDNKKPSFELYIKASTIDSESKGSCPICQQWFMLAYLLAEKQCVSFRVYTVLSSTPPKTFSEKLDGNPSQYPVVIGLCGEDSNSQSLDGRVADDIDAVEQFFEEVNPYYRDLKRNTTDNLNALHQFQDLSLKFNAFVQGTDKDGAKLTAYLSVLDKHLSKLETKFMCGNSLSYADCCLLPKLQHVRIAGYAYNNYEISQEFSGIWNYLKRAYTVPAFVQTLPADRDIISHYTQKAWRKLVGSKSPHLLKLEPPTISVPEKFMREEVGNTEEEEQQQVINNGEEQQQEQEEEAEPNRENGDDQDQMPEPDEINKEVYEEQQKLENDEGQSNGMNGENAHENSDLNE